MFGRDTPSRREQSHYSQRGLERQGYEYEIHDEESYYQANRGQPKAHVPGPSGQKHRSGRSSNPLPPSSRSGESSGYSGASAGGDPRYDDGFHSSHKATPRRSTPQPVRQQENVHVKRD